MKTENIYIGYNLDYEECLLEKQGNKYVDLFTRKEYLENQIYENILVPFSVLDNSSKRNFLWMIKTKYKKDREQNYDTTKLFIGDIYQLKKINSEEYYGTSWVDFGRTRNITSCILSQDVLFYNVDNNYYNLVDDKKYKNMWITTGVGDIYVDKDKMIPYYSYLVEQNVLNNDDIYDVERIEKKKKILECYHKVMKKGV